MAENNDFLFIGNSYGAAGQTISLTGTHNLNETRLIFLTYSSLLGEFSSPGKDVPFKVYLQLEKRLNELDEWILQGNTLVIFGASSFRFRYNNIANSSVPMHLEAMRPLDQVEFITASGSRVEYCGPLLAKDVFNDVLQKLGYQSVIKSDTLVPLLRAKTATGGGAPQIVGGYQKRGAGLILHLPQVAGSPEEISSYFARLASIPNLLNTSTVRLPGWIDNYKSHLELACTQKILDFETTITDLKSKIEAEQRNMDDHRALKALLAGSGAIFANAAANALREIGLVVVEGPHPRADLLSVHKGRFLAIEAKGVEGPVRETQFRQTERWVAEVNLAVSLPTEEANLDPDLKRYVATLATLDTPFEQVTESCKGVLIVGTFRSIPLAKRIEQDFPEPVSRLLIRSNICGLTGSQLYSLVMEVRDDPSVASAIVDEIVNTCGVFRRANNWPKYLKQLDELA
ncbi:hypothetical protein [Bradyrhizobium oligotrophicum]|uniref:hypothetical protein n=1 Tax=Bradyrhizobium oligotrophicum TaxID=44255 RepID=UPI003EB933B9